MSNSKHFRNITSKRLEGYRRALQERRGNQAFLEELSFQPEIVCKCGQTVTVDSLIVKCPSCEKVYDCEKLIEKSKSGEKH